MPLMVSSKAAVFLLLASSAAGLAFDSVVRSDAGPGVPVPPERYSANVTLATGNSIEYTSYVDIPAKRLRRVFHGQDAPEEYNFYANGTGYRVVPTETGGLACLNFTEEYGLFDPYHAFRNAADFDIKYSGPDSVSGVKCDTFKVTPKAHHLEQQDFFGVSMHIVSSTTTFYFLSGTNKLVQSVGASGSVTTVKAEVDKLAADAFQLPSFCL